MAGRFLGGVVISSGPGVGCCKHSQGAASQPTSHLTVTLGKSFLTTTVRGRVNICKMPMV